MVERERHLCALPFAGGWVIYELGAQHSREAPFVIAEAIELTN